MENLRGILFMTLAMFAFALEDVFIKAAARDLPAGQIIIVIGLGGGSLLALHARARGIRLITPVLLSPPVMIRNLAEILGTLGFVTAITLIPLSTASAILQATPLVITMGAALIFGEAVGWRRWCAIAVGLLGVLVILRPGLDGFDANALFAVLGVLGLGARDLAVRAVPRDVPNPQLAVYGFATLLPSGLILLAFSGPPVWPSPGNWALLLGATIVGVAAYLAITAASRLGDVSVVTPFRYTRLVFALALGIALFAERPDALTYLGAGLIVASGIYTFLRERRLTRAAGAAPAPGHPAGPRSNPGPREQPR